MLPSLGTTGFQLEQLMMVHTRTNASQSWDHGFSVRGEPRVLSSRRTTGSQLEELMFHMLEPMLPKLGTTGFELELPLVSKLGTMGSEFHEAFT